MNINALAREAVEDHGAQQKPRELAQLGRLLLTYRLKTAVEIGTSQGGTAWFWHALGLDVTTIDADQSYVRDPVDGIRYVEGRSGEIELPLSCDFLFIDGDHTYSGVISDWNRYLPVVDPGGIVAFHDIVEHPPEWTCDVWRFWRDLKDRANGRPMTEIIDHKQEGQWGGIGAIFC